MNRYHSLFSTITFFLLISLLTICPITPTATPVMAEEKNTLTVAFDNWPPWKIVDQKGYGGIDYDILKEIERRSTLQFQFIHCPWKRCIEMVRTGQVDLISSFARNPEREKFANYLILTVEDDIIFIAHPDSTFRVQSYEDLYGKRIGAVDGAVHFEQFDTDDRLIKETASKNWQLMKMLFNKRLELMIVYEITGDYTLREYGYENIFRKEAFRYENKRRLHFAASKQSGKANAIETLQNELIQLKSEGFFTQLIEQRYK